MQDALFAMTVKKSKKKRFYLKYSPENGGVYNCFNCGKSGNFIDLYSRIKGIPSNQAFKEVNNYTFSNLKESLKKKKEPKKKERKRSKSYRVYKIKKRLGFFGR
jgi:hypothetical protein